MPMAGQALSLYRRLIAEGKSELDASAIVTLHPEPDETHPAAAVQGEE
jgi:hypothetical protein